MAGLYTLFIHQQIYITIVLNFSCDGCNTQEKLETWLRHFFFLLLGERLNKVCYGLRE